MENSLPQSNNSLQGVDNEATRRRVASLSVIEIILYRMLVSIQNVSCREKVLGIIPVYLNFHQCQTFNLQQTDLGHKRSRCHHHQNPPVMDWKQKDSYHRVFYHPGRDQ
jgi:hypothetical protein